MHYVFLLHVLNKEDICFDEKLSQLLFSLIFYFRFRYLSRDMSQPWLFCDFFGHINVPCCELPMLLFTHASMLASDFSFFAYLIDECFYSVELQSTRASFTHTFHGSSLHFMLLLPWYNDYEILNIFKQVNHLLSFSLQAWLT